jgi:4'-phosphopantetheinyl transferase
MLPQMGGDVAAVFVLATAASAASARNLGTLLSECERRRMAAFHRISDRRLYAASHGAFRILVGRYLGMPARAVAFEKTGKRRAAPRIETSGSRGCVASLSHAWGHVAVALSRSGPTGVDIEPWHRGISLGAIESTGLSDLERRCLPARRTGRRDRALVRAWTAKEAVLKAWEVGLSVPPSSVRLDFDSQGVPRVAEIDPRFATDLELTVLDDPLGYPLCLSLALPRGIETICLAGGSVMDLLGLGERQ